MRACTKSVGKSECGRPAEKLYDSRGAGQYVVAARCSEHLMVHEKWVEVELTEEEASMLEVMTS